MTFHKLEKDHEMDEAQYRSIRLQDARGLLDDITGSRPWDPSFYNRMT